ncbi:MAG: helix-turn-helix domain-containing protein [Halodesulfurarchaeum sp.]|nr:helix-turn-helix domain-containing protein [Halodesulfurarchaeum sp.]
MTTGPDTSSEAADDSWSESGASLSVDRQGLTATFVIETDKPCPALELRGDRAGGTIRMESLEGQECVLEIATDDLDEACDLVKTMGGSCNCDSEREGDLPEDGVLKITHDRRHHCICDVFESYGHYPKLRTTANKSLQMEVKLADRDTLPSLVEDLNRAAESVRLADLTSAKPEHSEDVTLDLSVLTERQRDFFRRAVEEGLFEDPRRITVRELAEKLDISASAASRRLRRIQTKLFSQFEL